MNWKTIDSAPRDGTPILLAGGTYYHDNDGSWAATNLPHDMSIGQWERDGWWIGYGEMYDDEMWAEPTHWQPRPAPPPDPKP